MADRKVVMRIKCVVQGHILEMESPHEADAEALLAFIAGKYTDGKLPFSHAREDGEQS